MNVLVSACELGVVTRREIESGLVTVRAAGGSPRVQSILVRGHAIAYVKRPRVENPAAHTSNAERQTLRQASGVDLGPRLLHDVDDDVLWLSALSGRRLARPDSLTGIGAGVDFAELADVCQGWGAAVAALHREPAPRSGRPAARRPALPGATGGVEVRPSGSLVTQAIETDRALLRAFATVEQSWSDLHWIHGELSADHVMVDPWPSLHVRFVGFGAAGVGDPGWDLAGCLDTIAELVEPLHSTRVVPTARSRAQASLLGDYFLHAYRRAGGPGRVHPAMQAVQALSAAWRAANTDRESEAGDPRAAVLRRIGRAREFAARGDVELLAA